MILGAIAWFVFGCAVGALVAWGVLWRAGSFKPTFNLTVDERLIAHILNAQGLTVVRRDLVEPSDRVVH